MNITIVTCARCKKEMPEDYPFYYNVNAYSQEKSCIGSTQLCGRCLIDFVMWVRGDQNEN